MIMQITSTQNQMYKHIKALKTKKARDKAGQYTVEGIKSVRDALEAKAKIDCIVISDSQSFNIDFEKVYSMPKELFEKLCNTDTPQGILAVIDMQGKDLSIENERLILYCDRITDPGNLGTIIRICDAVDCTLILSEGTADIYNPKTVRASMGSFFHTKIVTSKNKEYLNELKNNGYTIISGALGQNTVDYRSPDYSKKTVIVIGNEANGIDDSILNISDVCVKIPIWGKAESLNAAVSAAILLYEARK